MAQAVVSAEELTAHNIDAVLAVAPRPGQERWVNPVAWYVARSAYERVWHPVALVSAGAVVGFAEWALDEPDGTYCLGGVVLDAPHQGRGLGRVAVDALVAHLRTLPGCGPIALTVHVDNERARGSTRGTASSRPARWSTTSW